MKTSYIIRQSVPVPVRTWYAGLVEDLALDDVDGLQGEYCAVQVKRLDMSALFCSHLKKCSLCIFGDLWLAYWYGLPRQGDRATWVDSRQGGRYNRTTRATQDVDSKMLI